MWKDVLYVCVSEGSHVKYIYLFCFLKSRVSEICVKRIRVNQGVGVDLGMKTTEQIWAQCAWIVGASTMKGRWIFWGVLLLSRFVGCCEANSTKLGFSTFPYGFSDLTIRNNLHFQV